MLNFLVNKNIETTLYLYKNSREVIGEINTDWVSSDYKVSLEDIDNFEISIPKFVTTHGKQKLNHIYQTIKPKMQIIMVIKIGDNIEKKRFIINKKSQTLKKFEGNKIFTCNSYEYILKTGRRCSFKGIYQLKTDETYISNGIMDNFIKANPDWRIGYVDPKSRIEKSSCMEVVNNVLFENFSNNKVSDNGLIWEKNITTNVENGKPLYLNIQHNSLCTFDDNGNPIIEDEDMYNAIEEPLSGNITNVKAYHYNGTGNRYGIRYVFTLSNGNTEERICNFTNIINKKVTCESITLNWETGNIIEKENVKYINIDEDNINWYDFLREVQDQLNSLFIFDGYNKTISVYSRNTIGQLSPLELGFNSGVISVETTEKSNYPCGLKVNGKDNLSIASENIFGGEIIYDYSWYKNNIMSDTLVSKWDRYEKYIATKKEEYNNVKENYMKAFQRVTVLNSEMKTLESKIKTLKDILATCVNHNDSQGQANAKMQIDEVTKQIEHDTTLMSNQAMLVQQYQDELNKIALELNKINATDNEGKIFDAEDLDELESLECIEEYDDDYYTVPLGLYNNAKAILQDKLKPQIDFTIECVNFIKLIQNPKGWNYVLTLGNWFNFDMVKDILEDIGEDLVRLTDITIDLKKKSINELTFTNKTRKIDRTRWASNAGKTANTAIKTSNSFGQIYNDAVNTVNQTKKLREGMLDLASTSARSRTSSNVIDLGSYGLFLIDATNQDNGLYMNNGLICMTTDGFKTCRTAISPEGITAEYLIGKEILGEKLLITNDKYNFKIDADGLKIYEGNSEIEENLRIFLGVEKDPVDNIFKARFRLRGKNSGETVISEEGVKQFGQFTDRDDLDENHPIRIPFMAMEGTFKFDKILLTLEFDKYRATAKTTSSSVIATGSTTSDGGGYVSAVTSEAGGGYSNTITSSASSLASSPGVFGDSGSDYNYWGSGVDGDTRHHVHYINLSVAVSDIDHSHQVDININPHIHSTNLNIPVHSHNFTINATHQHDLEFGVVEDTEPIGVSVYINDKLMVSDINNSTTIDITRGIELNKKNMIKITSRRKGRIIYNIAYKYTQQW